MKALAHLIIITLALLSGACGERAISQITDARSEQGLAYDLLGQGPLLVFIHGNNLDRRMWESSVAYFRSRATVLSYDLRGLGESATAVAQYSDHHDLVNLLDEIGESDAMIIGLSGGVQVALDVALAAPERVRSLVLVSPSLNGYVPAENPSYLPDLMAALRSRDFESADEVLLNSSIMAVPAEHAALVRKMVRESRQWELPYALMMPNPTPVLENLASVEVPVLLLIGENDIAAIHALGDLLQQQLPDARQVVIPAGGHLLNLIAPVAFHQEISEFFERDSE